MSGCALDPDVADEELADEKLVSEEADVAAPIQSTEDVDAYSQEPTAPGWDYYSAEELEAISAEDPTLTFRPPPGDGTFCHWCGDNLRCCVIGPEGTWECYPTSC